MYCKVQGCTFSSSHTTAGHKCGYCGRYGHGVIECRNPELKERLVQYNEDVLPEESQCSYRGCTFSWSHTNHAHHCSKCGIRGRHSIYDCPIKLLDISVVLNIEDHFHNMDNIYFTKNAGMGCSIFIRKKNGVFESLFMHSDSWGQYGEETDDTPIYQSFIRNMEEVPNTDNVFDSMNDLLLPHEFLSMDYSNLDNIVSSINTDMVEDTASSNIDEIIKCPLCRTENIKQKHVKNIKGISDKCSVCYDKEVSIYFTECEHACVCCDCYEKL